jgi:hypothetical protein
MLNITERERKSLLLYFPSTRFSENYILIPNYRLPALDYNRQFIDLLIYMPVGAEPQCYVPRDLVCLRGGNHHLDYGTEPSLARDWKKLCIRKSWRQEHGVMSVLNMVTEFFTDLPMKAVTY